MYLHNVGIIDDFSVTETLTKVVTISIYIDPSEGMYTIISTDYNNNSYYSSDFRHEIILW